MAQSKNEYLIQDTVLLLLFFVSGAAALIYQVVWQKLLFTAFGVNIQSVAIIISTFMLGLGIGALLGGVLAERYNNLQIMLFIFFELCIGIFGAISYDLITFVGLEVMLYSLPIIAGANFFLLLLPATLMGATLPILVSHLHKRSNNVGISIGKLYFSNTLGAATGSLMAGFVLLMFLKYSETLYVASGINILVAVLAYAFVYEKKKS